MPVSFQARARTLNIPNLDRRNFRSPLSSSLLFLLLFLLNTLMASPSSSHPSLILRRSIPTPAVPSRLTAAILSIPTPASPSRSSSLIPPRKTGEERWRPKTSLVDTRRLKRPKMFFSLFTAKTRGLLPYHLTRTDSVQKVCDGI